MRSQERGRKDMGGWTGTSRFGATKVKEVGHHGYTNRDEEGARWAHELVGGCARVEHFIFRFWRGHVEQRRRQSATVATTPRVNFWLKYRNGLWPDAHVPTEVVIYVLEVNLAALLTVSRQLKKVTEMGDSENTLWRVEISPESTG